MAKAGFWLLGARGHFNGAVLKGQVGGGTQIAAIPASVANPNTEMQVETRSKFKLMSQLAANMADVIAIPREGTKSPRNLFFSINSENAHTTNGVAQISLENVQLTKSAKGLPQIVAIRGGESDAYALQLVLAGDISPIASRVCYVIMEKTSEGNLALLGDPIVNVDSENKNAHLNWGATGDVTGKNIVIYAYGMLDRDGAAAAKYGNMHVEGSTDVARLVTNRTFSISDYSFTQTRGASLYSDQHSVEPVPQNSVRVYVTSLGKGTVSGGGTYTIGSQVTVTAVPASGSTFKGWKINGSTSGYVSQSASYTFTAPSDTVDLVAEFYTPSGGSTGNDD